LLKNSILVLLLECDFGFAFGWRSDQRCGKGFVLNPALAAEGATAVRNRVRQQTVQPLNSTPKPTTDNIQC
jgi:hypothetical protein